MNALQTQRQSDIYDKFDQIFLCYVIYLAKMVLTATLRFGCVFKSSIKSVMLVTFLGLSTWHNEFTASETGSADNSDI